MRKAFALLALLAFSTSMIGCKYAGQSTSLSDVAKAHEMVNVTTGDGTFENYNAIGHYKGVEFGIAVGIPFLLKLIELVPAQTNEDLLGQIASRAKADGSNAMINVTPHQEVYYGFPFFIVGIYVDRTEGTGIKVK